MKKMKKLAAFAMAAAMVMGLAACGEAPASSAAGSAASAAGSTAGSAAATGSLDKIKSAGQLVMATNAEFPPFEFKDGGEVKGIDVEIAKQIAEKLGVKLEIHDVQFKSCIPELQSDKSDIVAAGISITDERLEEVDFSDPYFDATQSIIVLKDSAIKDRKGLEGKKVGVQEGTTGDSYCTNEDGTGDVKDIQVSRYAKGMDAVADLIAGRLDAVVIDDFPAQKLVQQNSEKVQKLDDAMTVEHYAIAVKKGNEALVKTVNEVLKEMKDSGALNKLVEDNKAALEGE